MRRRRSITVFIVGAIILLLLGGAMPSIVEESVPDRTASTAQSHDQAGADAKQSARESLELLDQLEVKGRAPKTNFSREQFGNGWGKTSGCSTRDIILYRDLQSPVLEDECTVVAGTLLDPYTGETIYFTRANASAVQIDHVVALSNAWQTGAQQLTAERRKQLANDPLELLAVDGGANQAKSDGDAATWLPKNKAFRCEYVTRQIAVKKKYALWVTSAEKEAMQRVLSACT